MDRIKDSAVDTPNISTEHRDLTINHPSNNSQYVKNSNVRVNIHPGLPKEDTDRTVLAKEEPIWSSKLKWKDISCFKTSPPVWGSEIHNTCNETTTIAGTDSTAKGVFSAGHSASHIVRDDAEDPRFVIDLDFTLPITISSEIFAHARYLAYFHS